MSLVELVGGPFDGEMIDTDTVCHDAGCTLDHPLDSLEIESYTCDLHATYVRCDLCGVYEYVDLGDEEDA
jgi:hypothetical protein